MKMLGKSNEAGRQGGGGERRVGGWGKVKKTERGYLSRIFNMSSCSLAQFNLSLVCFFFSAFSLPISLSPSVSFTPSPSHSLLLFVCEIMKASPAKPLTRKTLSNLISIISKEQPQSQAPQAPQAAPSTSRKPHIPLPSFSLSCSLVLCLSRSVCCCCYPNTVAIRNVCSAVPLYP